MTHLLSAIEMQGLCTAPGRKNLNGIMMLPIVYNGERNVQIQLDPVVTCQWEPSAFESTGRLNATFTIDNNTAALLENIEDFLAKGGHSAVKRKDGYEPGFKTKYNPDHTQFVDADGRPTTPPEQWRDWRMRVIVSPRSVYQQSKMSGVVWELVGVQLLEKVPPKKVMFL